jgi:hypothetical protein
MITKEHALPTDRYWASVDLDVPVSERRQIGELIAEQFRRFWAGCQARGMVAMWQANLRAYYGQDPNGSYARSAAIMFGGSQGELALIHTGDYRQLVRSMHTLATSQRPAIECTATSNDPEAISQTITARQVLDYDLDEGSGGLEECFDRVHERALVCGEGYVVDEWDPDVGEAIGLAPAPMIDAPEAMPEAQAPERPVYQGGARARYKSPWDVARDLDVDRSAEHRWYVVRDRVHRWEYVARYPEHARTIVAAPAARDGEHQVWSRTSRDGSSDYVELLTLYHVPSAALPRGRRTEVIAGAVLIDVDYPAEHMLVHADLPSEELDEAMGYSDAWDLLALQSALNSNEGAMLTVSDVGGVPNWIARRGQQVDSRMLAGGLRIVEHDSEPGEDPPGLAEMPEIKDTQFKYSEHLTAKMQRNSGINGVVRGDPDENIKSGAYAALVASMAVQANSAQQRAYAKLMRSVLNGRLKLYQLNASEERIIEIAGKDTLGHVRSFTSKDLSRIRRVRVELANPILRTIQGKKEIADKLVELYGPAIISPDRYLAFQQTGRLDDLENQEASEKVNARRENEMMREAAQNPQVQQAQAMVQQAQAAPVDPMAMQVSMQAAQVLAANVPQAAVCDLHDIHIREHFAEIRDPAVRIDPAHEQFRALLLAHVQAHVQMRKNADPDLLAATGQRPAMPSMPEGPPMGAPPNGGPGGPPPPEGPPPEAVAPGATDVSGGAPPNMPQMPINPANGQRGAGMPTPTGGY